MRMLSSSITLILFAALDTLAAAQGIGTIASESFDYPVGNLGGANGGTGFETPWDAGPNLDNGVVLSPSMDGVGNRARLNINTAQCHRELDLTAAAPLLVNGQLGRDGTRVWVSFDCVRAVNVVTGFGGISLYDEGGTERMFIGSPWGYDEWGLDSHPGGPTESIPGSDVDVPTRLVVRIEFKPGDDVVELWLDPAVPHPTTTPDLSITALDFTFSRIRLASGHTNGDDLYDFDGILIEGEGLVSGTAFCFGDGAGTACPCGNSGGAGEGCANSTGSGGVVESSGTSSVGADDLEFQATQLPPFQPALLFVGVNAINGGQGIPFGDGLRCAGGNVVRLGVVAADAAGAASWGPGLGAAGGWGAGDVRRFQVWYRDPGSSPCGFLFNLSNGVEATFSS